MRKLFRSFLIAGALVSVNASAMNLTFKVSDVTPDNNKVTVIIDGKENVVTLDANGQGSIELTNFKPQYVHIRHGRQQKKLYLEADKDLTLSYAPSTLYKEVVFEGPNASINEYLSSPIKAMGYNDAGVPEAEFIKKTNDQLTENLQNLKSKNLPKEFADKEADRLVYYTLSGLPMYPVFYPYVSKDTAYKASPVIFNEVKKFARYNGDLLYLPEYREFINSAATLLSMEKSGIVKDQKQMVNQQMDYIANSIKDLKIQEYLMNQVVYGYVENNGLDNPVFESNFKKFVKDQEKIQKFNDLLSVWEKIKVGAPSPSFKYKDINGNEVALSDLKGKLVYIDVWATWCGPCRGEIPHLKKMEEKYHGKDIEFVSISCDQNKDAWEKMVAKEELKGVQLHHGGDREFMEAYLIKGIPRFILLDKEGKIVSANMTRPSNPATEARINELLD